MRRREEKGYFNNMLQELMIEDTPGYREMMRMTDDDFLVILWFIEPDIKPLLRFRLRLGVSLVIISPFSTTSTSSFFVYKTLNKRHR